MLRVESVIFNLVTITQRNMKRYERYGEIWRDMVRYGEIWGYREIWRDMERYEKIL